MPNNIAKFFYRSYCDMDVTSYTISGDYESTANAVDRNKLTYALTDGFDTDGVSADFIVDLNYAREIDTIVLKSNLKTFVLYYWDENATGTGGGDWIEIQSYASDTTGFIVYNFSEIESDQIKITATHTITADEEKKIYLFEITKKIDEINLENIDFDKVWSQANFSNIYGGSVQVNKYPNYGKIEIDLSWKNLTGTDYIAYAALKAQRLIDAFNCYLYFSDTYSLLNVEAYYLVNDISNFKSTPSGEAMTEGVSGELKFREC